MVGIDAVANSTIQQNIQPVNPRELAIDGAGRPGNASGVDFRSLLSEAFNLVQRVAGNDVGKTAARPDAVDLAKSDLFPSPYKMHPTRGREDQSITGSVFSGSGVEALTKSFDHALSMALLSHLISGISSTTSSLLRQA